MNKDIETRLKTLRLTPPPPELKSKVLSNARSAWSKENDGTVLHMQFRHVFALAASFILFIGVIAFLNRMEERDTRQALNSSWEKTRTSSENAEFLKELGFSPEYCSLIAEMRDSPQLELKSFSNRFEEELKL
ncbi:MAG: hypothetical protein WCS96_11975 [Victivallales bacterium]